MQLEYIAHATFLLTLADGRRLILDPYQGMTFNGRFNYPPFAVSADFALITHEHIDHNYLGDLRNIPVVVRNAWRDAGLKITSQFVWHDKFEGTKFGGGVSMKFIEADGIRLCHMGDCGEILSDAQIAQMGDIDVLLIPVGGFYTIDGHEAAALAKRIRAKTVVPCHYKTSLCGLPISGPEVFLSHFEHVSRLEDCRVALEDMASGVVVVPPRFGELAISN
ncbi:MAG: MBL fold metallo-hydrolase [Proteobacteria bacterium]|nr:MBL fold metallo-hydrolase [Pseudomonadota bacterium]